MHAQTGITALPTPLACGQKNPFQQQDGQTSSFVMALLVGYILTVQMRQRRSLFLIVLLFQAQRNKEQLLIKC